MSDRRSVLEFAAIAAGAAGLRVAYVLLQSRFDLFVLSFSGGDAQLYLEIARNIANGHGMSVADRPTAFVGPGYPLFLAALLRLGADPVAVGIVQAALGAATAVLAGLTTLELARSIAVPTRAQRPLALASAGVAAAYPHLIFWTGYVLTETLFVTLVSAALYAVVRSHRTSSRAWTLVAGLAAGAASVTRAPFLAVSLVIALCWWLQTPRRADAGSAGRPLVAGLFLLAMLAPVGVWTARNVLVMGAAIVTSTESGFVFYQGNSPGATGGTRGYVDDKDFSLPPGLPPPGGEVEQDRFFLQNAVAHIASDPGATISRWPAKILNMWRPTYDQASTRNILITLISYAPVLVAGLLGAGILLARGGIRSAGAIPAVVLAIWFAIHVAVTGMIRFRLAAELVLIESAPFAALAAVEAVRRRFRG